MHREPYHSESSPAVWPIRTLPPDSSETGNSVETGRALEFSATGSEDRFQKLQLRIAAKAGERCDSPALIQFFCQAAREFFQVSGVYFWRCHSAQELGGQRLRNAESHFPYRHNSIIPEMNIP